MLRSPGATVPGWMKVTALDLDPRIRRTRQMLHRAFEALLAEKNFEEITVHDIAERSTVNRATFYDHFPDKFALLEDLISENFKTILETRMQGSSGTCPESVTQLIRTVCDFFGDLASRCQKHQRQFAPIVESKIRSLVREFLLEGQIKTFPQVAETELGLRATMASWAICGAALEWSHVKAPALEGFAESVFSLVRSILQLESGHGDIPK